MTGKLGDLGRAIASACSPVGMAKECEVVSLLKAADQTMQVPLRAVGEAPDAMQTVPLSTVAFVLDSFAGDKDAMFPLEALASAAAYMCAQGDEARDIPDEIVASAVAAWFASTVPGVREALYPMFPGEATDMGWRMSNSLAWLMACSSRKALGASEPAELENVIEPDGTQIGSLSCDADGEGDDEYSDIDEFDIACICSQPGTFFDWRASTDDEFATALDKSGFMDAMRLSNTFGIPFIDTVREPARMTAECMSVIAYAMAGAPFAPVTAVDVMDAWFHLFEMSGSELEPRNVSKEKAKAKAFIDKATGGQRDLADYGDLSHASERIRTEWGSANAMMGELYGWQRPTPAFSEELAAVAKRDMEGHIAPNVLAQMAVALAGDAPSKFRAMELIDSTELPSYESDGLVPSVCIVRAAADAGSLLRRSNSSKGSQNPQRDMTMSGDLAWFCTLSLSIGKEERAILSAEGRDGKQVSELCDDNRLIREGMPMNASMVFLPRKKMFDSRYAGRASELCNMCRDEIVEIGKGTQTSNPYSAVADYMLVDESSRIKEIDLKDGNIALIANALNAISVSMVQDRRKRSIPDHLEDKNSTGMIANVFDAIGECLALSPEQGEIESDFIWKAMAVGILRSVFGDDYQVHGLCKEIASICALITPEMAAVYPDLFYALNGGEGEESAETAAQLQSSSKEVGIVVDNDENAATVAREFVNRRSALKSVLHAIATGAPVILLDCNEGMLPDDVTRTIENAFATEGRPEIPEQLRGHGFTYMHSGGNQPMFKKILSNASKRKQIVLCDAADFKSIKRSINPILALRAAATRSDSCVIILIRNHDLYEAVAEMDETAFIECPVVSIRTPEPEEIVDTVAAVLAQRGIEKDRKEIAEAISARIIGTQGAFVKAIGYANAAAAEIHDGYEGSPVTLASLAIMTAREGYHRRPLFDIDMDEPLPSVVGQSRAKEAVAGWMAMDSYGLGRKGGCRGVLLFAGPSGTGKTLAAHDIANKLSEPGTKELLIPMSEYAEAFTSSKMLGAPPGYVGYDNGGVLTEYISEHYNGVVVLDEFEKCHQKVRDTLLSAFETGMLQANDGSEIDASGITFVLTTNAGTEAASKPALGFGSSNDTQKAVEEELVRTLGAPMMGRVDVSVAFNPLSEDDVKGILENSRKELMEATAGDEVIAKFLRSRKVKDEIAAISRERAEDPLGARGALSDFRKRIEVPAIQKAVEAKRKAQKARRAASAKR
jgi:MoxR-like ATPase